MSCIHSHRLTYGSVCTSIEVGNFSSDELSHTLSLPRCYLWRGCLMWRCKETAPGRWHRFRDISLGNLDCCYQTASYHRTQARDIAQTSLDITDN